MKISKNRVPLAAKEFLFPAGEIGVSLDTQNFLYRDRVASHQTIVGRIRSSDDFFRVALARDALSRFDSTPVRLFLPCAPYARQDRVCNPGDPFSLKVFAGLINSLGFERVTLFDPHSDVCGAVFDRARIVSQLQIINRYEALIERVLKGVVFVSPDAGGNKKTSDLAAYFGHRGFVRADKLRDLATGAIKETIVYADDLGGQDVLIADDICDGGRTFIELAKVLKAKNAGKVILYITHGIFTKGTDCLYQEGIDEIYTTNSYHDVFPAGISDQVRVLNLETEFADQL